MNLSLYIEDRDDLLSLYDQLEKNKIEYYCKSSQIKNIDFTSPDVIVTGANILITTINAVFAIFKEKQNNKIAISGSDWKIEVPANIDKAEIEYYVNLAKSKTADQIIINVHKGK